MNNNPQDKLDMDYINSLPQPFLVRFLADRQWWPVYDIDVETGLLRIDIVGLLEIKEFIEVREIRDDSGRIHDPEDFWIDAIREDKANEEGK